MNHPFETLLSPILRRGFLIKNRMGMSRAYPPFSTGVESPDLLRSFIPYIRNLAKNGPALVTFPSTRWESRDSRPMQFPFPGPMPGEMETEDAIPEFMKDQDGPPAPGTMGGPDLSIANVKLTYIHAVQAVHDEGALAMISLMEIEPSGWTIDEIPAEALSRMTDDFARRCRQYKAIGFDGCGFYMCYRSSLMAKALSPQFNHRTDRYGTPWALALEAFQKVRMACGENFLIEIEVSGTDLTGGYTTSDLSTYLKVWEPYIDIVQVRAPTVELAHPVGINSKKELPRTLSYTRELKESGLNLIFAPVGGFQDPEIIEACLKNGELDMVYMARAFLCDSRYYEKILAGAGNTITPCIRCNKCHTKPAEANPGCSVNPLLSLTCMPGYLPPKSPETQKKIVVIGGGPAGMTAALTAAEQGHEVVLFEQKDTLGGQLLYAGCADFKWPIREFCNNLCNRVHCSTIDLRLKTHATPSLVALEAPDAIIYACGAIPKMPNISGVEHAKPAISVYGNTENLGHSIVIVGGSETGLETAMYLSALGRHVTLLTRQRQIAHDSHDVHYREIVEEYWRKMPEITPITSAVTTVITEKSVTYRKGGQEMTVSCDQVLVVGMESVQQDVLDYAAITPCFRMIGDSHKVGDIRLALREGYTAAIQLS